MVEALPDANGTAQGVGLGAKDETDPNPPGWAMDGFANWIRVSSRIMSWQRYKLMCNLGESSLVSAPEKAQSELKPVGSRTRAAPRPVSSARRSKGCVSQPGCTSYYPF
eukprot:5482406-Amphidinium_carterae.2